MKKSLLVIIILVVGAVLIGKFGSGLNLNKDKNVSPSRSVSLMPTPSQAKEIEVFLPSPDTKVVGTKFVIYGRGRGFENTINYNIADAEDGRLLKAGNMMTNAQDVGQFGYFYKEIDLNKELGSGLPTDILLSVFEAAAKDGTPIHKTTFELNVKKDVTAVFAYFNNANLDPETSCTKTFAVSRLLPKTQLVLKTAIEQLLNGPAAKEKELGFVTLINPGVKINSLKLENGTAKIDFSQTLQEKVGGSCRVAAIRWQIINTAKQFPNVKDVLVSINGRTEDILQP